MAGQACVGCGAQIAKRRAFISLFVLGDEEIRSWYFCDTCRCWTVEEYLDRFIGETNVTVRGPFPEQACAADVALVDTCPDPGSKWCACDTHRRLVVPHG